MQNTKLVNNPLFGIKTDLNIIKISQKNGLKVDEFKTHQIPPNLNFFLSLSKENKILFVLKQFSFFLGTFFCFTLQSFLNQPPKLKLVSFSWFQI